MDPVPNVDCDVNMNEKGIGSLGLLERAIYTLNVDTTVTLLAEGSTYDHMIRCLYLSPFRHMKKTDQLDIYFTCFQKYLHRLSESELLTDKECFISVLIYCMLFVLMQLRRCDMVRLLLTDDWTSGMLYESHTQLLLVEAVTHHRCQACMKSFLGHGGNIELVRKVPMVVDKFFGYDDEFQRGSADDKFSILRVLFDGELDMSFQNSQEVLTRADRKCTRLMIQAGILQTLEHSCDVVPTLFCRMFWCRQWDLLGLLYACGFPPDSSFPSKAEVYLDITDLREIAQWLYHCTQCNVIDMTLERCVQAMRYESRTLMNLSVIAIRSNIRGNILHDVKALCLSKKLNRTLLFEDIL